MKGVSPGILVSFTNKTDRQGITEILLNVALIIITLIMCNKSINPRRILSKWFYQGRKASYYDFPIRL